MPAQTKPLTLRALNRATLARQMLLERAKVSPLAAIETLFALQAQAPRPPFVGLWTRVHGFKRDDLNALLAKRTVIRTTGMRATLHLMSAKDYLAVRALLQPSLEKALRAVLGPRIDALDREALSAAARELLDERPQTFDELRTALGTRFPKVDVRAAAYSVRISLPIVQVPDGSAWGFPASSDFAAAETWLKKKPGTKDFAEALVLRYLRAFGPASVTDAQTWSGVSKLRDTFEALRKKLITFKDERGRELFDLPDAPRPKEDVEAPVRLLPEWDNLMLGHDDRARVIPPQHRAALNTRNLQLPGTLLVDGFVSGTWKATDRGVTLATFGKLPRATLAALESEALSLARFLERPAKVEIAPYRAS